MERRGTKLVIVLLLATSGGCLKQVFGGKSGRPENQPQAVSKSPAPAPQGPDQLCPVQGATGMVTCS